LALEKGGRPLKKYRPIFSHCVFNRDGAISTELDQYAISMNLGHTGLSLERLQMGPIGLREGWPLVAELETDIVSLCI
jgi:hypothetical protein